MATQYGWVIEHADSEPSRPLYWCGEIAKRHWSYDHNDAIRFAREDDAQRFVARCMPGDKNTKHRICEHGWD